MLTLSATDSAFLGAAIGTDESRPTLQCVNVFDFRGERVAVTTNGYALHMVRGVDVEIGVYTFHAVKGGAVLVPTALNYPEVLWMLEPDRQYLPATIPVLPAPAAKALRDAKYAALLQNMDGRAEVAGYFPVGIPGGAGNAILNPVLLHDAIRHMPQKNKVAEVQVGIVDSTHAVAIVGGRYQAFVMPMKSTR